ncbi:histidine kinase [Sulfurimonas denitrificans DSM 1251]|uniref:histidine kinase n=1 Tax=Sulfurimonas denitrificans (strain ATCC 33889 / DSM 1251) TaxID=326298 RepID=Q30S68_SULDN|nr:HAMP domain-containing sensor histidine kinase [Sulfurimonas denitrificans]ABB44163.1 histidine kinase [Sulfurimonas denitrificans DSM 1251]MDD3441828.1 HAMP domain-containing sensor histidine kinase [Sulfurimonas denitrificans]
MQNIALSISSKIISSYMHSEELHVEAVDGYEIALYSIDKEPIAGEFSGVKFVQGFYEDGEFDYFVDLTPQLHHGVKYLVLKSKNANEQILKLIKNTLFIAIFSVILVVVVGYFLTKMFLKPIQNERIKFDKFIKDSTHELNTPITAILMSIDRLKKENIDEKILSRVQISAKRVQKIYSDLTYLLMDNKSQETKKLNIKSMIESELTLYEDLASKKSLTIEKELEDLFFSIDEVSAQRLFSNLLSNAIKYNKHGGVIEIKLKNGELIISNSGIGIKKELQDKIFDRFYRANDYEGGFGIGLDIVKRVCSRYSIDIKISSKESSKTTIKLKF